MATYAVNLSSQVKLDGSGNGQISLTPPSGSRWDLSLASVSTTSTVKFAEAFLYLGNASTYYQLIDSTYDGNSASSTQVAGVPLFHGQYLWAVWTGGDSQALATLQIYGDQVTGYR